MSYRLMIFLTVLFMLVSCKSTQYVDKPVYVETVKTEYVQSVRVDSVFVKDSSNTYIVNDTIYKDRIKYYYKTVVEKDTVHIADTIPTVVEVEKKIVEEVNVFTWYQRMFMFSGIGALMSLLIYLVTRIKRNGF